MSSPSRSRRSTATAPSTSCAASSRPAPPTASRSIPATTTTSCSTCSRRSSCRRTAASRHGAHQGRAARPLERVGARRRSSCSSASTPRSPPAIAPADLLALDSQVTDCNAAIFDVANDFHGVIAGCHEILRRQGLLEGIWCLDPNETLGPGQTARDRPRLRRLSASQRRRVRAARTCEQMAVMMLGDARRADEPLSRSARPGTHDCRYDEHVGHPASKRVGIL